MLALAGKAVSLRALNCHGFPNQSLPGTRAGLPLKLTTSGRVSITSQNHGFAVDEATLPSNVRAIHKSLFDGSLQGIERTDKSAFSFQGHPEASPGPNDVAPLFDRFINEMAKRR